MSSLKFGTSGLRGLVVDLVGWPAYAHALAFFRHVDRPVAGAVVIGRDLRASSPEIAAAVVAAAREAGLTPLDCGAVPTPALALEAMTRKVPAVMVTGSHIPEDRNGLKFYTAAGEITKDDEAGILAALPTTPHATPTATGEPCPEAQARYLARYRDAFPPDCLKGMRVGVYEQSSVARDLLAEALTALGAIPVPFGRASVFVPVDTEAHRPEDLAALREAAKAHTVDAIVTTDGDADRPLVADEHGEVLRGDVLGLIAARSLGIAVVAVPVTAGSAIERRGGFARVIRTRVGSPHVIAGMAEAERAGLGAVAGFEANGGFLLGSDVVRGGRRLAALPTRDAMLPILATLAAAREAGQPLSAIVTALEAGETASDRLKDVPAERSSRLLHDLADAAYRTRFLAPVGQVARLDDLDGVRIELTDGATIHFRASGNAPELRCYAEAASAAEAQRLVQWGLAAATAAMAAP